MRAAIFGGPFTDEQRRVIIEAASSFFLEASVLTVVLGLLEQFVQSDFRASIPNLLLPVFAGVLFFVVGYRLRLRINTKGDDDGS